jgi:hypothetical protein
VVFLLEPGAKEKVAAVIAKEGAQVLDAKVAEQGVSIKTRTGRSR